VKNMRIVVSTGYYDLPPHLKACLLYISIFSKNFEIRQDRLIWRWIAQGFVHPSNEQGESLFDLGQNYFYDIINKSIDLVSKTSIILIMGTGMSVLRCEFPSDGDFIRCLSSQENFVVALYNNQWVLPSDEPVRQVSICDTP
jgi:hypothetical protein